MRPGNRVLAALVAALLAAAGVIAVVEIVAASGGRGPVIVDWPAWSAHLTAWAWSSGAARFWGVLLALVGLGLLLLGSRAGGRPRFQARPTTSGASGASSSRVSSSGASASRASVSGASGACASGAAAEVAVYVPRSALARALRATALATDGITSVSVRVRRRRAVVRPRLRGRTSVGAVTEVRARLARTIESFELRRPPRLVLEPAVGGRPRRLRRGSRRIRPDGAAGAPTGWGTSAARRRVAGGVHTQDAHTQDAHVRDVHAAGDGAAGGGAAGGAAAAQDALGARERPR
ncbi:hypothetical protein Ga0074812_121123 [Parafrankia irregularis]|uniref:DUF6286 domain-containing protein n=1 Tax=Parafrankia irregularis TaxID=795642 RepID=A0A0S4QW86_9ACTN|nr:MULTISPECIES: DUF6286 domain-containing protein [Parafrankia]MBE3205033.1 hypothetical protein [Parafrankia sp. CH37]CUU58746.1 hypothetical protein Ga0074812_121123 [Parafrankia irregularis]